MEVATASSISIVNTKFRPPKQKRRLLKRERLMRDFMRSKDRRLILVTAPAGYGKTTLLSQIFESLSVQRHPVAWLSVDRDDNDPVRFLSHLQRAIAGASKHTGRAGADGTAEGTHSPGFLPSISAARAELLNYLAELDADVYLFLDDFHLVDEPVVLDLVSALLLAPVDKLHVVLASRRLPDFPTARLRAAGDLLEISTQQLALSSDETNAFVDVAGGPRISMAQAEKLHEKTEGWVVSLQLAMIAMQSSDNTDSFIRDFGGADSNIEDFLMEEVIQQLPENIQDFLLATSVLDKFSAELADAVLGRQDSRSIIDRLESLNLFIFSLDRERIWYRYHHLFSELLQKRLGERHTMDMQEYHARACNWLEARGLLTEAIEHALAIGESAHAGALLDAACVDLFASGQTTLLRGYAARLPSEVLQRLPGLQLELAWENGIQWRFEEARLGLESVRSHISEDRDASPLRPLPFDLDATLAHREIMLQVFTDDLRSVLKSGPEWLRRYGRRDTFMSGSIAVALIMCRREQFSCELTPTESEEMRRLFVDAGLLYGNVFLDTVVGSVYVMKGNLGDAEHSFRQAQQLAQRIRGEESTLWAMPTVQLAQLLYETNRLDEAHQMVQGCSELSPAFGLVDSVIAMQMTLANLARSRNDLAGAHAALDTATYIADKYMLQRLHAYTLAERVRLLIADGQLREAERLCASPRYADCLSSISPSTDADTTREQYAVAAARLACERGDFDYAIRLVRRWLAWTRERQCLRSVVRLSVLLSHLHVRAGDAPAARRALIDAIHLACKGPFVRTFIDEGPVIAHLIDEVMNSMRQMESLPRDYVELLMQATGNEAPTAAIRLTPIQAEASPPTGSFSARELEILRLTSENLANQEIANALGLADSTVKWYWKRIFEKLSVNRRAAAVRLARQRGIIP